MGVLLNESTGERIALHEYHVIGRDVLHSDTYLSDLYVSMLHATLRWSDDGWLISDNSRNGTFLEGRLLRKGQWIHLQLGERLRFGSESADIWRIVDISAPVTALIPLDADGEKIVLSQNNLLPNPEAAELSIYQTADDQWILETLSLFEARALENGDTISLSGTRFRLHVTRNLDVSQTRTNASVLSGVPPHFKFMLSLDEEHTQVQIRFGDECIDLGEREHHYCLVTLARQRMADARAGIDPSAQGWLECSELLKMLGIEIEYLNIQIFRIRNQLSKHVPVCPQLANIIDRRRGSIRFGAIAFEIVRGSQTEDNFQPDGSDS